jgi:hypothetical protein
MKVGPPSGRLRGLAGSQLTEHILLLILDGSVREPA